MTKHIRVRGLVGGINSSLESSYKHIFLIFGEPRTGKSTLGMLSTVLFGTQFVDTDFMDDVILLDEVRDGVFDFINDAGVCILIVVVGKHRLRMGEIEDVVREFQSDDVLVSTCLFSR